jgi:hypothetical protein
MPKIGKDFIPHQLGLTQAQINKLIDGKPINIAHRMMGSGAGDTVMLLKPQNARKLLTAFKKGKGMRITLHPEEIQHSVVSGRGFGKKLLKGLKAIGRNPAVKDLGKQLVQQGSQALGMAIGSYTGNPQMGMMLGDTIGQVGSDMIDSGVQGKKGSLKESAKSVARIAINDSINELPIEYREAAKMALAGDRRGAITSATSSVIDNKVPAKYRNAARLALAGDTSGALDDVMEQEMHRYASGGYGVVKKGSAEMREKMAAIRAMKGGKVNVKDIVSKGVKKLSSPVSTVESLYNKAVKSTGMGIRSRGRPRKVGGEVATSSKAYKRALRLNYAGLEFDNKAVNSAPLSDFDVNPRVKPSSTEMTLSPYQRMDSPAMNPFIPTNYVQQGGNSCGYGGKGLYGRGLY